MRPNSACRRPSTLRSRLTRRNAAEARWAGQAAQLPKLGIRFDGWRSGWWRLMESLSFGRSRAVGWLERFHQFIRVTRVVVGYARDGDKEKHEHQTDKVDCHHLASSS